MSLTKKNQPTASELSAALGVSEMSAASAGERPAEKKAGGKAARGATRKTSAGSHVDAGATRRVGVDLSEEHFMKLKMEALRQKCTVATLIRNWIDSL